MLVAVGIFLDDMYDPHSIFRRIGMLHAPVYQWVESDSRTFDFLPGEGKGWGPIDPQQGEIRYDIRAALPVDTGLMDSKWADRMDAWNFLSRNATCFETNIRKSTKSCRMTTGKAQVIFIRDRRAKQAGLDFEKMYGTKGSSAEPNSVTITILTRKCVENCKYALD